MTAGCIAWERPDRGLIELTGTDRVKFLHNFCTHDINRLPAGNAREAFLCNVKGRIVGHVSVLALPEALLLETGAAGVASLLAHLDRYLIREDVTLTDRTGDLAAVWISGTDCAQVLARAVGVSLTTAAPDHVQQVMSPVLGASIVLATLPRLSTEDSVAFIPRSATSTLWNALDTAGVRRGTDAEWTAQRIAAGFPEYGVDLTDDCLAQEAGRNARCLSFKKGCYLGQEPIARLDALGHTNRELRRLHWSTSEAVPVGTRLIEPASGQEAGWITSCAVLPDGSATVALGFVKARWMADGTLLQLAERSTPVRVQTVGY